MLYGEKLDVNDTFHLTKTKYINNELSFEDSSLSQIKFDGKTIVVLCGNKTKSPTGASFYSVHNLYWLNNYADKENVTAYSIYYPSTQPLLNNLITNPTLDYKGLAQSLFNPILFTDGKPRTTEEISQSFGDITFFGHSIGGFVMNELMNNLGDILKSNKFSAKDIEKIYSSIVFVGYSPYELVGAPIKGIYITPLYDSMGSTKLACERIKKRNDFICSRPNFDINEVCRLKYETNPDFIARYNSLSDNANSVYFMNKNTLIATPNLLFDDGITEDHNLAGVLHYAVDKQEKTTAGRITTKFLDTVLTYSFSVPREDFSTKELYVKSVEDANLEQETFNSNKEL